MSFSRSGRRRLMILALATALALPALTSCGRKGSPEPPEGSTYPQQYPDRGYQ